MLITAAAVHQSSGIGKKRGPSTTNGILQRFEVQLAVTEEISQHESCCSTSQQLEIITNPSEAEPIVRCPCCRSTQVKLICVNCLCTNVLRIGRIKDELRRLQQSKIAVCNLIENVLIEEVKFESNHQQLKRSIENLKTKIGWKKEQVGRLRQRIANMEGQSERNHRNVVLLEKKMVSHAQRIQRTNLKIEEFRGLNVNAKIKLAEQIAQISKSLLQIFRLEKRQLFSGGDQLPTVWTGQSKMHHRAAYLLNNFLCLDRSTLLSKAFAQTHPPGHNHSFGQLPSPSSLQPNFPHDSLAALTFAAQLAQMFAHIFHFHLPYPQLHKTIMLLPTAGGLLIPQESAMRQALFKLDFSCLHLCLSQGISPEECELTEPLANLHGLITRILAGKMVDCVPRLDQRLLRQICEQFTAVQPDGRVLSEFTLDNVENDWVKVHCSQ